jgi:diphosphomevalonate decarboxylase
MKKQHEDKSMDLQFNFDGKRSEAFEKRIDAYFNRILDKYAFLSDYQFKIESSNTFPHSSGIASSASAFSALALCIMSLKEIVVGEISKNEFFQHASHLARLGSGSASRSVYGGYTVWGKVEGMGTYSDIYARPLQSEVHPIFQSYQDAILIVSAKNKKVGSTAGHALMEKNPFAEARYRQAMDHTIEMLQVLKTGDTEKFVKIVEQEAMTLHGLMMSSDPGYILIKQETIEIIDRIHSFKEEKQIPVAFTLDAGPNVHLLYPASSREEVLHFINDELLQFCEGRQWIDDSIGKGPKLMNV